MNEEAQQTTVGEDTEPHETMDGDPEAEPTEPEPTEPEPAEPEPEADPEPEGDGNE